MFICIDSRHNKSNLLLLLCFLLLLLLLFLHLLLIFLFLLHLFFLILLLLLHPLHPASHLNNKENLIVQEIIMFKHLHLSPSHFWNESVKKLLPKFNLLKEVQKKYYYQIIFKKKCSKLYIFLNLL